MFSLGINQKSFTFGDLLGKDGQQTKLTLITAHTRLGGKLMGPF